MNKATENLLSTENANTALQLCTANATMEELEEMSAAIDAAKMKKESYSKIR